MSRMKYNADIADLKNTSFDSVKDERSEPFSSPAPSFRAPRLSRGGRGTLYFIKVLPAAIATRSGACVSPRPLR